MVVALLLVLLAPVFLAIAALILGDDGWPVIFTQTRVGKAGRYFTMYKFRTMTRGSGEKGIEMGLTSDPYGLVPDDPRITTVGRFLRRTGLDELPQLLNVVKGDMRLVGPRPDLPEQAAFYEEDDRIRLRVKPGITGWAQVHGREAITWPERFVLDRWYVEHRSFRLDVSILVKTALQLRRGDGKPLDDDLHRRPGSSDAPAS